MTLAVAMTHTADLEDVTEKLATFGQITTNVAFRSPVRDRPLPPGADADDLAAGPA